MLLATVTVPDETNAFHTFYLVHFASVDGPNGLACFVHHRCRACHHHRPTDARRQSGVKGEATPSVLPTDYDLTPHRLKTAARLCQVGMVDDCRSYDWVRIRDSAPLFESDQIRLQPLTNPAHEMVVVARLNNRAHSLWSA